MKKKFLVIGANGQDGYYISKLIIKSKNYLLCIGRQKKSKFEKELKSFKYFQLNLKNSKKLLFLLKKIKPDFIINLAAFHGSSEKKWNNNLESSIEVNTIPTKIILEYISKYALNCFYFFASSILCLKKDKKINEKSKRINKNPYQISKNNSEVLINDFRKKYSIKASIAWFFQHESQHRQESFFIPKVLSILKKSISNNKYKSYVNNLNFYNDWGSAQEFMEIIFKIVKKKVNTDFVIATGKTHHATDVVNNLFKQYNLNYKDHIIEKNRVKKSFKYTADISKLKKKINSFPKKNIYKVCSDIIKNL